MADLPEPQLEASRALHDRLPPQRWQCVVEKALRQLAIVKGVEALVGKTGMSQRQSLEAVAPKVKWPRYEKWVQRLRTREGPEWERLLDERVTPPPDSLSPEVITATIELRQQDPGMSWKDALKTLQARFPERGGISKTSLGRIWKSAHLTNIGTCAGSGRTGESVTSIYSGLRGVEVFHGGGAQALLGAAATETGGAMELAAAVLEAAHLTAAKVCEEAASYPSPPEGRDDRGRFTAAYNHDVRKDLAPGEPDPRWTSEATKRTQRDVNGMRLLEHSEQVVAEKLLAMGAAPLLTECRGFDGLASPQGAYLELMGIYPYMPSTLDKALGEMARLGVASAVWDAYARWARRMQEGTLEDEQRPWKMLVFYVDSTQEPYWTNKYALSGPVSRLHKTMPCFSRVTVSGGEGPPLYVKTVAGAVSLKTALAPTLTHLKEILRDDIGRLTIVDAEICTLKNLIELAKMTPRHIFITVLKGQIAKNAILEPAGDWQPYRERDQVQEGTVRFPSKAAPADFKLRTVTMDRPDSRHPEPTIFVTNGTLEELQTPHVPTAYLDRFPIQEQQYRETRNGGGLNHTHGYGGEYVTHVAFDTKLEEAQRAVERAEAKVAEAEQLELDLKKRQKRTQAEKRAIKVVEQTAEEGRQNLERARQAWLERQTTPREIFQRDVTRDSIVTAAKLLVLTLCTFVIREYLQCPGMTYRTFINLFVQLPVTVATTFSTITYAIHASARAPDTIEALRKACAEINRRKLYRDERLLLFNVIEPKR